MSTRLLPQGICICSSFHPELFSSVWLHRYHRIWISVLMSTAWRGLCCMIYLPITYISHGAFSPSLLSVAFPKCLPLSSLMLEMHICVVVLLFLIVLFYLLSSLEGKLYEGRVLFYILLLHMYRSSINTHWTCFPLAKSTNKTKSQ